MSLNLNNAQRKLPKGTADGDYLLPNAPDGLETKWVSKKKSYPENLTYNALRNMYYSLIDALNFK